MKTIIENMIKKYNENFKTNMYKYQKKIDIDIDLLKRGLQEKKNDTIIDKTIYVVFDNHPRSLGMTYKEHMNVSLYLAFNSLTAFFIFIIHAFFPILFNHKGTDTLKNMIEFSESINNEN
tara:strand:- start:15065 stop:15424 length:360 start_codon:yes stop_codon:yes gene_type:complete